MNVYRARSGKLSQLVDALGMVLVESKSGCALGVYLSKKYRYE